MKNRLFLVRALFALLSNHILLAILLLLAVYCLYAPFLGSPIVFDDLDFFREGSFGMRHFGSDFATLFEIRGLPYASLTWTAEMIGLEMAPFRIGNLLIHAATAIALFYFISKLAECVLEDEIRACRPESSIRWLAFVAALLFAIHPVAVYGVAYLIQRTILMATFFSLLALHAYLLGIVTERKIWLVMSVAFYACAVLSKEHAIMLPAVMLALTVLLSKVPLRLIRQLWWVYIALGVVAVYVIGLKIGLLGAIYEPNAVAMLTQYDEMPSHAQLLSALTQSYLYFKYCLLWLLPNPGWMSIDMRESFASGLRTPFWLAAIAFVAYGALALRLLLLRGRLGVLGFAMLFPWLLFFTEFSTVRIQESFVLYRSYLWMVGAFIAIFFILYELSTKRLFFVTLSLVFLLFPVSLDRLASFSHPVLLWSDAANLVGEKQHLPGVSRIYYNRGMALIDIDNYKGGLEDLLTALRLEPRSYVNHSGVGVAYLKLQRYPEAINEYNKAIQMEPGYVNAYLGRGMAYYASGNRKDAILDFERCCAMGLKSGCERVAKIQANM